jgi:asparagine synthase (glutamine-hydrolysing)
MNVFCGVVRFDGAPVPDAWRIRFASAPCCRTLSLDFVESTGFWGFVGGDAAGRRPTWVRHRHRIAIGTVRLDDPPAAGKTQSGASVVASELKHIAGTWWGEAQATAKLIGDFAFVIYDERSRAIVGARDVFGVDTLYYRVFADVVTFASRADLLATEGEYDRQFLAEFVARADSGGSRTPYNGVSAVPPAHVVRTIARKVVTQRYWSAAAFTKPDARPWPTLVHEFREHFATAVRTRLSPSARTWAQLSGGLDSSSVVSMAQSLASDGREPNGLGGTVTLVDAHGTGGDERYFSDTVVSEYGIRNEQVSGYGWWQSDGAEPPRTDLPTPAYLMYARDRRMAEVVRAAGGEVLLSGYGADHYLGGSAVFLADWAAQGRWRAALKESMRWAVAGHVSFWTFAMHNIALPLCPSVVLRRLVPAVSVPMWVHPRAVSEFALAERTVTQQAYGGRAGGKYIESVLHTLDAMPSVLALHAVTQDIIEERHPFLYRPLVELALGLPAQLCAQPMARKWILREAMRGVLPERVRTRPGKGSIDGSLARSLAREAEWMRALLDCSVLVEMGLVNHAALMRAIEEGAQGTDFQRGAIVRTLALECWLQVRSGRWVDLERKVVESTTTYDQQKVFLNGGRYEHDQAAL